MTHMCKHRNTLICQNNIRCTLYCVHNIRFLLRSISRECYHPKIPLQHRLPFFFLFTSSSNSSLRCNSFRFASRTLSLTFSLSRLSNSIFSLSAFHRRSFSLSLTNRRLSAVALPLWPLRLLPPVSEARASSRSWSTICRWYRFLLDWLVRESLYLLRERCEWLVALETEVSTVAVECAEEDRARVSSPGWKDRGLRSPVTVPDSVARNGYSCRAWALERFRAGDRNRGGVCVRPFEGVERGRAKGSICAFKCGLLFVLASFNDSA